jgi:serine palmitoyltransferase
VTALSGGGPPTPEDEFSDYSSTVSSYADSVRTGSRASSEEELAEAYKNYLETPFVSTKQTIKHSEYGHCNNPNWRWTSQVSVYAVSSVARVLTFQWNPDEPIHPEGEANPAYFVLVTTYIR